MNTGNDRALDKVLEQFARKMLPRIRQILGQRIRSRVSEEDVLASAYASFQRRGFSFGDNRAIWGILAQLVIHKALNERQKHVRGKRNVHTELVKSPDMMVPEGAKVIRPEPAQRKYHKDPEPELSPDSFFDSKPSLDSFFDNDTIDMLFHGADPEQATLVIDSLDHLPEDLRAVAILKLQGHSDGEIGRILHTSGRTVRRWLSTAYQLMTDELGKLR